MNFKHYLKATMPVRIGWLIGQCAIAILLRGKWSLMAGFAALVIMENIALLVYAIIQTKHERKMRDHRTEVDELKALMESEEYGEVMRKILLINSDTRQISLKKN